MKWNKGIVSVVAAATLLAGVAFAQDPGHRGPPPGGPGHGNPLAWVIEQLDLTEEQEALVEAWREEARAEREEMRAEREEMRDTIRAELTGGNPNPRTFHRLIDERAEDRVARAHTQIDRFFELYATFTPEQKEELARIVEEGPPEGEGFRGPRTGEGGGPRPWER